MEEGSLVDVTGDNCKQLVGSRVQIVVRPTDGKSEESSAKTKTSSRKRVTLKPEAEVAQSADQSNPAMEKPKTETPAEQKTAATDLAKEPDSANDHGQESETKIEDGADSHTKPAPNPTEELAEITSTNGAKYKNDNQDPLIDSEKKETPEESAKLEESDKPDPTNLSTKEGQIKLEQGDPNKSDALKSAEESSKSAANTSCESKTNDNQADKAPQEKKEESVSKVKLAEEGHAKKEDVPLGNASTEAPIECAGVNSAANAEASEVKMADGPLVLPTPEEDVQAQPAHAAESIQPITEEPVKNDSKIDGSAGSDAPPKSQSPAINKAKKLVKKKDSKVKQPIVDEKTPSMEPDSVGVASGSDAPIAAVEPLDEVVPPAEDRKEESLDSDGKRGDGLEISSEVIQETEQPINDAFCETETNSKINREDPLDLSQILATVSDKLDDLEEETRLGQAMMVTKTPFAPSLDEKRSIEELLAAARPSRTIEQLIASSIVTYEETMNAHRRRKVDQVYVCTLAALKLK